MLRREAHVSAILMQVRHNIVRHPQAGTLGCLKLRPTTLRLAKGAFAWSLSKDCLKTA